MIHLKLSISFLTLILTPVKIFAQQSDPDIYKNKDYINAVQWLHKNYYIYDSLTAYHVPPDESVAIIFPELMRYSAMEDKMEVTGLMVLYTRLGKDYADFSVGHFQMKPSFVRQLETDAAKYLPNKVVHRICPFLLNGQDVQEIRKERVSSLTRVENEVAYLALFYKIVLARFKKIHFKNAMERIKFLATAYNCGYHHTLKYIEHQMQKKQFPVYNGLLVRHVNYAELSLAWWNKAKKN